MNAPLSKNYVVTDSSSFDQKNEFTLFTWLSYVPRHEEQNPFKPVFYVQKMGINS